MTPFVLHLQDISQYRRVDNVVSFIGADAGGSFGVLARHERMMTALAWGLARYRTADGAWHYLVLPGGLLYAVRGELFVATRRFCQDDDLDRILGLYEAQLRREEDDLRALKQQIQQLEQEMLKRLWRMELGAGEP
jgi:F-type H+-transporting ATPase subunit epsilon